MNMVKTYKILMKIFKKKYLDTSIYKTINNLSNNNICIFKNLYLTNKNRIIIK